MNKFTINELQISCLSRINFVYLDLVKNPPMIFIPDAPGNTIQEKTKNLLSTLSSSEINNFNIQMKEYLSKESITMAKIMLIINYLGALFKNGKNDYISIFKNDRLDKKKILKFTTENNDLLQRIKIARNKLFSHVDPDWLNKTKNITFDEIKKCIDFLVDLLNFQGDLA